jgi:hypothetical protein
MAKKKPVKKYISTKCWNDGHVWKAEVRYLVTQLGPDNERYEVVVCPKCKSNNKVRRPIQR